MPTMRCNFYAGKALSLLLNSAVALISSLRRMRNEDTKSQGIWGSMLSTVKLSDYLHFRHNGVIIEAIETATEGDENSSTRSRSGTPLSSKNNENPNGVPVQAHQGVPTATGPSSYYRQHTALTNRKFAFSLLSSISYAPIQRTYRLDFSKKCNRTNLFIRHPQPGRHLLGQATLTGRMVYHHRI